MATALSIFAEKYHKALAAVGFGVRSSRTQADADVPTVTSGAGAPSATVPDGSIYLRTDAADAATSIYSRISGSWTPIVGT